MRFIPFFLVPQSIQSDAFSSFLNAGAGRMREVVVACTFVSLIHCDVKDALLAQFEYVSVVEMVAELLGGQGRSRSSSSDLYFVSTVRIGIDPILGRSIFAPDPWKHLNLGPVAAYENGL